MYILLLVLGRSGRQSFGSIYQRLVFVQLLAYQWPCPPPFIINLPYIVTHLTTSSQLQLAYKDFTSLATSNILMYVVQVLIWGGGKGHAAHLIFYLGRVTKDHVHLGEEKGSQSCVCVCVIINWSAWQQLGHGASQQSYLTSRWPHSTCIEYMQEPVYNYGEGSWPGYVSEWISSG